MSTPTRSLRYFDQATGERYVPYVIEPSFGLTRSMMAFLVDAYVEDEAPNTKGGVDKRVVLKLDPRLAPVKAAVLPLSKKAELSEPATKLANELRGLWNVDYDGRALLAAVTAARMRLVPVLHHRGLRYPRGSGCDHPRARHHEPGACGSGSGEVLPGCTPGGLKLS